MAYSPNIPTIQTCLYHCKLQKTLQLNTNTTSPFIGFCPMVCLPICPSLCHYTYSNNPILPSPPNFPPSKPTIKPHNIISPLLITMITLFSLSFVLIVFYILYIKLYRISQRSESVSDRNYSLDEEHGNRVDFHYPFWNITTFGLALSAIQRIPIKNYVKENDVEERDCTVCLGEFKEGESLRVLPKCCHVFHVSCIDTWLASHITCPICRSLVLPLDQNHDHNHDQDHDCEV